MYHSARAARFCLVLGNVPEVDVKQEDVRRLCLWIDKLKAHCFIKKMSPRAPSLMEDLRMLHRLLSRLCNTLALKWLPSAANYFADRESRIWDPGDLYMRARVSRATLTSFVLVIVFDVGT